MDEILPALQSEAIQHDIQVIFVDMRYGVRNENTLDHMTWIACHHELKKCEQESMGMFFLSLQVSYSLSNLSQI
jgi:hypothetical protein